MSADPSRTFNAAPGGLAVRVRVSPRASKDAIHGVGVGTGGRAALKVAVTAVPEAGKANEAVIALLAKVWRLPKSSMRVARGGASRDKSIIIEGDPEALGRRLDRWLKEHHG